MFARSRVGRSKQRSPKPKRKQRNATHEARSPRPKQKHRHLHVRSDNNKAVQSPSTNYYDVEEATAFISEFDKTLEQLHKAERKISEGFGRSSKTSKDYDLDKILEEACLSKRQKQALLLLLLCYDADFPASIFSKLCKSVTMKKIMEKLLNGESITKLLSGLA